MTHLYIKNVKFKRGTCSASTWQDCLVERECERERKRAIERVQIGKTRSCHGRLCHGESSFPCLLEMELELKNLTSFLSLSTVTPVFPEIEQSTN